MSKNDKKAFGSDLASKVKKLGELTLKIRQQKDEARKKSKGTETQDADVDNRTVARVLKQDGDVIETSGTVDAQHSGDFAKVVKQAGVKKEDIRYTAPSKNAETLSDNRIEDSIETEPKTENLKKHDKIIDIAESQANIEAKKKRKRDSVANMMRLLQTVNKLATSGGLKQTPAEAGMPIDISSALNKDHPLNAPFFNKEEHNKDAQMEAGLEEKLTRHFSPKLQKADFNETVKRAKVEHGVQEKLKDHQPNAKLKDQYKGNKPSFKLLTAMEGNPKTAKNEIFDKHMSAILHLAPATLAGIGNICEGSTDGCRHSCLNTAGRGGMFKEGDSLEGVSTIQAARIRKTRELANNPGQFMDNLINDIHKLTTYAKQSGKKAVVRLNGTSDLAWEKIGLPHFGGKNIFQGFPDIQFYDYTKRPDRVMSNQHDNYHLTFSKSEANDRVAKRLLDAGHNVAVVFGGKGLPSHWHGKPVVNADEHDFRFLDQKGGVVAGLKAKGPAKKDSSGFVVWDHEGNPEKVGPKASEGPSKFDQVQQMSDKLNKAKFEDSYDPSAKRIVRAKRHSAPRDPMANKKAGRVKWLADQKKKPSSELHPATQEELENISSKVKMKKADDGSGKWLSNKNKKLPSPPESILPPSKEKKDNGKDAPVLNYKDINKITTKPAANSLDYSKFPPPPEKDPTWKQKLDFSNPKPKDPPQSRGVVRQPAENKPRAIIRKEDMKKTDLTKDNKPHAPGSPEDSAHDVVEEGSSIKKELSSLGSADKMKQMLHHLRGLKSQGQQRSPANQKEGLAKQDPQLDAGGVAGMKNAFGGGGSSSAPTPSSPDTGSLGGNITAGLKNMFGKSDLHKNCGSTLSKCRDYLKKGKLVDIKTGKAPEKAPRTTQSNQLFALDRKLKGEKPKAAPKPSDKPAPKD
jgi:hypothetical protein